MVPTRLKNQGMVDLQDHLTQESTFHRAEMGQDSTECQHKVSKKGHHHQVVKRNQRRIMEVLGRQLHESNRVKNNHTLKVADKQNNKKSLPDIQGASTFQEKCAVLKARCFPNNVGPTSPMPDSFLPTPSKVLINTLRKVTANNIANWGQASNKDAIIGKINFSYPVIAVTEAGMIAKVFTNLLKYGVFPVAWKIAKCILS